MDDAVFSIKSSSSDRELVFREPSTAGFVVELCGTNLRAVRLVSSYMDEDGVAHLFSRLATRSAPWGEERWESLEGEFSISATCSRAGSVTLSVAIVDRFGGPEDWDVRASLTLDFGQLPAIARDAKRFFDTEEGT